MRVLALDPGERVGWASAVVEDNPDHRIPVRPARTYVGAATADVVLPPPGPIEFTLGKRLVVTGHGISYLKDMALAVHQAVAVEKRYDVVVYEKWKLTAKGARVSVGSYMESSQFVGMLRLACWLGGTKCVGQQPSMQTPGTGTAVRALRCGHPSAAAVRQIIDKLPAAHDESHDRSALLHLWGWFFERYV